MIDLSIIAAAAPTGGEGNVVTEITQTFGVNWKLFISQLISFTIVALVLKKFAFGPIQEMLEQRRYRIADGESKLAEIEKQLADSEKHTEEVINKANDDAKRMIEEAKESSANLTEKKAQEAVASAQNIIAKAEEAAKAEREQMQAELKSQFGRLVTAATTNVTGKVLNDDDQRRINEEALSTVEN